MVAQFIWLLDIEPKTTYWQVNSDTQNGQPGIGVGDFDLILGRPWPFSEIDVWNYLLDSRRVAQTSPICCSSHPCSAYVLIGAGYLSTDLTSDSEVDKPGLAIFYDIPSYVVEFQASSEIVWENLDKNWAHCVDYTTSANVSITMCLGGDYLASKDESSIINAAWFLASPGKSLPPRNVIEPSTWRGTQTTRIQISKANTTAVADLNGTIIDVIDIGGRVQYKVNISELFAAFTAPLTYNPVNPDEVLAIEAAVRDGVYINYTDVYSNIFLDNDSGSVNSSIYTDSVRNAIFYAIIDSNTPPGLEIQSFLAHALVTNSRYTATPRGVDADFVIPQDILSISSVSISVFAALTGGVLLACMIMLCIGLYRGAVIPNSCLYPDVAIGGKFGADMIKAMDGLSNAPSRTMIEKFAEVMVKVGEQNDDGKLRVIISTTTDVPPLRRNVAYA